MLKKPWICPACKSTVSTRDAPAVVMRSATILALIEHHRHDAGDGIFLDRQAIDASGATTLGDVLATVQQQRVSGVAVAAGADQRVAAAGTRSRGAERLRSEADEYFAAAAAGRRRGEALSRAAGWPMGAASSAAGRPPASTRCWTATVASAT